MQAAQVTMEDHVMAHMGFAPLQVVGYEGALGTFAMAAILLPIVQALPGKDGEGIHENTLESWHMVKPLSVARRPDTRCISRRLPTQ